jgi:RNA polymerase sigma-70 factor (ECF subfamily)
MVKDSDDKGGERAGPETDPSLLEQVRQGEEEAWRLLVERYGPTVYGWCRAKGLRAEDASDVEQDVFVALLRSIGRFHRDEPGDTFRGWLWSVTMKKATDYWRRRYRRAEPAAAGGTDAQERLVGEPVPQDPDSSVGQEGQASQGPFRQALARVQAAFTLPTWRAFWLTAVEGRPASEVARELGLTMGAVYVARSRVLRRLREETGLLDD